jgi:transcriptional regulator with XRE-family HTH domain
MDKGVYKMIAISEEEALGRQLEAGRIMAGLSQGELGALAGLSASTVSNIENGRNSTSDSVRAVRRALRGKGVNLTFGNNQAQVSICFIDRNAEDED